MLLQSVEFNFFDDCFLMTDIFYQSPILTKFGQDALVIKKSES